MNPLMIGKGYMTAIGIIIYLVGELAKLLGVNEVGGPMQEIGTFVGGLGAARKAVKGN